MRQLFFLQSINTKTAESEKKYLTNDGTQKYFHENVESKHTDNLARKSKIPQDTPEQNLVLEYGTH